MIKRGSKVKIIGNSACSSHKIGDIGIVISSVSISNGMAYLISVNGHYNENSTWSYERDLQVITELNKNIKIL